MNDYEQKIKEINQLIDDLYSSICFEEGEQPPLEILRRVFIPGGKMINNDDDTPRILTVEEYIDRFNEIVASGKFKSFHEIEISHKTDLFGKIAHRFSTYETRLSLDEAEPYSMGINSIQLIKIGPSWFISSMVWNNQTDNRKIPEQYL